MRISGPPERSESDRNWDSDLFRSIRCLELEVYP